MQEATWPKANVIVGNPPFLGGGKLLRELGDDYVGALRQTYAGRVPGGADLVCYWFEKARAQMETGQAQRAGLVATNSIRGGSNRKVLERILATPSPLTGEGGGGGEKLAIFHAWSDEPWVNEGAAVRVSLVGFGAATDKLMLNNQLVAEIYADLTPRKNDEVDLTRVSPLDENKNTSFEGTKKYGKFDIPGHLARQWLFLPNPNNKPNTDVLKPWANGMDITRRPSDTWIIDFGTDRLEEESALYEIPFQYIVQYVKPARKDKNWFLHERSRPELRKVLNKLKERYIVTPRVSKYRLFVWQSIAILPDTATVIITREDDTTFGILQSKVHEIWSLRMCTWIGVGNDPRYSHQFTFRTFPFPFGLTPNIPASAYADDPRAQAIAEAARKLNELRENWLNPPQWVDWIPEVVPGYPDRLIPKPEHAAELKKRTLTNLYNQRPAWLDHAHRTLDAAVAAAYGWPADLSDDEVLRRLLALNRERTLTGEIQ